MCAWINMTFKFLSYKEENSMLSILSGHERPFRCFTNPKDKWNYETESFRLFIFILHRTWTHVAWIIAYCITLKWYIYRTCTGGQCYFQKKLTFICNGPKNVTFNIPLLLMIKNSEECSNPLLLTPSKLKKGNNPLFLKIQ